MKMTYRSFLLSLLAFTAATAAEARLLSFSVTAADIHGSYVTERIPLAAYAMPSVKPGEAIYSREISALPDKRDTAFTALLPALKVMLGMERKQPFALLKFPGYRRDAGGILHALTSITVDVMEAENLRPASLAALAKGTSTSSALATGTWYKIAVPAAGVYKLDYNFISTTLGVNLSGLASANIRLLGNGGRMLSENNAVARPLDLVENAIQVVDGGDGAMNSGDYLLFYATGPTGWQPDAANDRFLHTKNLYADSSYYFISFDGGTPGLRVANAAGVAAPNKTVSTYNDYQLHELDLFNPGHFGKSWYGEKFGTYTTQGVAGDINLNVAPGADSMKIRAITADASSVDGATMAFSLNGQAFYTAHYVAIPASDEPSPVSGLYIFDGAVPFNGGTAANFHLTYTPSASDGNDYLDFIELNYRRPLSFTGGVMAFRDLKSFGTGNVAAYQLQNANGNTSVWDVTNPLVPQAIPGSLSGGTYAFNQDAATLHEFVAMDGSSYGTPYFAGKVANQNIHGHDAVDLFIVAPEDFAAAAKKIADFHTDHDGLRCFVVSPQQIYNEFSSGGQDVTAIRDMARYFYLRAGADTVQMPRYMLLLGDASYDYKNRIAANTNIVPTYESDESVYPGNFYVVDEYYGFLDDNENINDDNIANTIDMSTGRLPVHTEDEADAVANKIINYSGAASFGPWKLRNTYVADNEDDAGDHLLDAEAIETAVNATTMLYNDDKVYLDNLPFVSTPGGIRCPDANKAINDDIYKGTFLINYTGHGNTQTLAHERILTATDFNTWKNFNSLPFMVTATCDFARYDDPGYLSAGEALAIKADGGAIALLTTTASVYATSNGTINESYIRNQYSQRADGSWPTFGDAYRIGKNETYRNVGGDIINFRRFVLMGDPALQPAFPKQFVHTDSLTDVSTGQHTDTLSALGTYRLDGHVSDPHGALLPAFNGRAYVTIYDKPRNIHLLTKDRGDARDYTLRDNIIYKGIATVTGGAFSLTFIAPKDINYDFGQAKVSYYAENGVTDAAGADTLLKSGGYSDNPFTDNDAPVVQPYMNDSLFRDGGITGASTLLYVKLSDASGINVSGNSVGHDLIAILDGNTGTPYNLNDYYETAPNSYQTGYVHFPITGLADGAHTFLVRAWDVADNSGEGTVHFIVKDGAVVAIQNLINYPNPFNDATHFFFEHNHPNELMHVQIAIYATDGRLVRLLEQDFTPGGSHSNEIIWDGTDASGARLQGGVYPYRMILSDDKGVRGSAYQKLVISR